MRIFKFLVNNTRDFEEFNIERKNGWKKTRRKNIGREKYRKQEYEMKINT